MRSGMTLDRAHVEGFDLVREHSTQFVRCIRALTDEELARPVPGADWTVGQTFTHVGSVYERYTIDPRRAASPQDVSVQNTENTEDIERRGVDIAASCASIEEQVARMGAIVEHVAPTQTFPFHAGVETTIAGGWGNLLGELLAHGDDIARATGWDFAVPSPDLEILWRYTAPLLDGWLTPDAEQVDESWDLRFPFGTIQLAIDHGTLHHGDDIDPRPEHREIVVDDVAEWTLAFPYRRRPLPAGEPSLLASRFQSL